MRSQQIASGADDRDEPDNRLLTIAAACTLLSVGRTMLYELLASNQLQAIKIGQRRMILARSVDAMVARKLAEASQ